MSIQQTLKKKPPIIMGILNLTPDSFSDGGKFNNLKKAILRAIEIEKQGADIIDIGGESTGPGSKDVSLKGELNRIIPSLIEIRKYIKIPISIDTNKAEVASKSLEHGANMINDVTALRGDKNMANVIAKFNCPIILMYSKDSTPRTTIKEKNYKDVMETIKKFFTKQIIYAKSKGVKPDQIIIDPGMGQFISSKAIYSYEIIARTKELQSLGLPIALGLSRKSFLGGAIKSRDNIAKPLHTIAYLNAVSIIRTHDVKGTKELFKDQIGYEQNAVKLHF